MPNWAAKSGTQSLGFGRALGFVAAARWGLCSEPDETPRVCAGVALTTKGSSAAAQIPQT
jgi:hypothetical protein